MLKLLFTTAHLKSSQFGFYILFLCNAYQQDTFYYLPKYRVISINKKMNNNCIEDLQEFLNLPGISHDNNYVYFSLKKPMEKARSIEVEEESLLYVYDKYSLGGLKIYCQLAWIDKYQKQSGELSPFYYQTVNTLLNIPNASYLMKAMRKDGIIDYDIMGKDEHLKKLISVNSSLRL